MSAEPHDVEEEFVRNATRLGFRIPTGDARRMSARFTQIEASLEGIRQLDLSPFEPAVSLNLAEVSGADRQES